MNKEEKEKEYKSLTQKYIYKCAGKDKRRQSRKESFANLYVVEFRIGYEWIGGVVDNLLRYDWWRSIVYVVGVGVVGRHDICICLVFFLYFLLPLLLVKEKLDYLRKKSLECQV